MTSTTLSRTETPIQKPTASGNRYSAEEKQQIIEQWRESGMSRPAFCREKKISYYSFLEWTKKKTAALRYTRAPSFNGAQKRQSGFLPLHIHSPVWGEQKIFAQAEFGSGRSIRFFQPIAASYLKNLLL